MEQFLIRISETVNYPRAILPSHWNFQWRRSICRRLILFMKSYFGNLLSLMFLHEILWQCPTRSLFQLLRWELLDFETIIKMKTILARIFENEIARYFLDWYFQKECFEKFEFTSHVWRRDREFHSSNLRDKIKNIFLSIFDWAVSLMPQILLVRTPLLSDIVKLIVTVVVQMTPY